MRLGRPAEALRSSEQAVAVLQAQFGAGDPRTVRAQTASAMLVADPRRAAALLRGNVRDAEETGEPATLASSLQAYGRALYEAGDHDSAAAALEQVVTMRSGGTEPRVLALAYTDLSRLALERGDVARALGYSEEALKTARALVPAPGVRLDVLLCAATARAEALVGSERADDAVSVLDPVVGAARVAPEGMARAETVMRAERVLCAAYAQI